MEASSGPAKLAGPTGPDKRQAPRFRSGEFDHHIRHALVSLWWIITWLGSMWFEQIAPIQTVYAFAQQTSIQQLALLQQEIAPQHRVGVI